MNDAWPTAVMKSRLQDLLETAEALSSLPKGSGFTEVCLSRYLAVRSAGYIETVRDDAADYFCTFHSHEAVARRIRKDLRKGTGANWDQLADFIKSFDPEWANEFKVFLAKDDDRLKDLLKNLVTSRKKIAHGEGDPVNAPRALEWSKAAEEIGQWFIRRFDPSFASASNNPGD